LRALRSGEWQGGKAARPFIRTIEPPRVLGASRRASRSGSKGAALSCCKASERRSRDRDSGAAWKEEPFESSEAEQSGKLVFGAQRRNAPRLSMTIAPFAGRDGTEGLGDWRIAFAR
jgi:hypothetical protein